MMILLLPGMDGTPELRADFVKALEPIAPVTTVAYPRDQPLDYSQLESIAREFMPDDPFIILGESFSGPIAVAMAASNPSGLRGLILAGSFAQSPTRLPGILQNLAALLPVSLVPDRLISSLLLGRNASPAMRKRVSEAIATVAPEVWRARMRAVLAADNSIDLEKITVPVLYLRATRDRIVPHRVSEELMHLSSHTRLVELDSPHFMLLARPAETAKQVELFIREVSK